MVFSSSLVSPGAGYLTDKGVQHLQDNVPLTFVFQLLFDLFLKAGKSKVPIEIIITYIRVYHEALPVFKKLYSGSPILVLRKIIYQLSWK